MMVPMTRDQVSVMLSSLQETVESEKKALAESQSKIDHRILDWDGHEPTKEERTETSSELAVYYDDLMALAQTRYMIRVFQTLLMTNEP